MNNYNNAQWLIDSTGHVLYDFNARSFVVSAEAGRETVYLCQINTATILKRSDEKRNLNWVWLMYTVTPNFLSR